MQTELHNLSQNIIKKMKELDVSLPEMAKLMQMEYQTLWRIANPQINYMPNLRALHPIAQFFNVKIADLLKYPSVPQYVPIIKISEIPLYFTDSNVDQAQIIKNLSQTNYILSESFIDKNAFAISIATNIANISASTIYIFKPHENIKMNNCLLIQNEHEYSICLINSIAHNIVTGFDLQKNKNISLNPEKISIKAIAVKQIVDNILY